MPVTDPHYDSSSPLPPPGWATRSIAEDGGITHETISPLHPTIIRSAPHGWELVPTEVTLSVTDLHINGRWVRTWPTIQIEGGSYSPQGAPLLDTAVRTLLAMVTADEPGQMSPSAEQQPEEDL